MVPLLTIPRQILNGHVGRTVGERRKTAEPIRIKKRLRLLNNLLVLFVPRAELTQPRIVAVLYRITARLSIPSGDNAAQQ